MNCILLISHAFVVDVIIVNLLSYGFLFTEKKLSIMNKIYISIYTSVCVLESYQQLRMQRLRIHSSGM